MGLHGPVHQSDSIHEVRPGYLPGKPYGDWDRNTAYHITFWLPERRAYYLSRMQTAGLYQP